MSTENFSTFAARKYGNVHRKCKSNKSGNSFGYLGIGDKRLTQAEKKLEYFFKRACRNKKEYYFCTPVLRETGRNRKRIDFAIKRKVHRHNEAQPRKGTARKSLVNLRQDFERYSQDLESIFILKTLIQ